MHLSIYLAGTIKKGHEDLNESCWTEEDLEAIRKSLPECTVHFLNPAVRADDLGVQASVFGRDMCQVFSSDLVFADVRERRGRGVGAEIMWAKMHRIPVVMWAPANSHYRKDKAMVLNTQVSGWTHPFVERLADAIVESTAEGAAWIRDHLLQPGFVARGYEEIQADMQTYLETQFHQDLPMLEIAPFNHKLRARAGQLAEV